MYDSFMMSRKYGVGEVWYNEFMLPESLQAAIDALALLPGVGAKSAERFAYYLFKSDEKIAAQISEALKDLHENVKLCPKTFALIDASEEFSKLYLDEGRDRKMVLVVEEPLDIYAIEQTRNYRGTYHVLGGTISPIDGVGPENLHIRELISRILEDEVIEVIIATNPSVEGESTALMLEKMLHEKFPELRVTRLARGLPLGVDLSYADQITLSAALENRTNL
ncbi:MAG: recombination mediator RecR [Candidatus Saccharibacteria bacterium]|nr:recombination mediator RecR [Candidatus Saccharibacteria bacterium]